MNDRAISKQSRTTASSSARQHDLSQRNFACVTHTTRSGECTSCARKQLQRRAEAGTVTREVAPEVYTVLSSAGQPLEVGTRAFMEPRFGQDFSGVRVHADSSAAASAHAVGAHAYTVGQHIVFGSGGYVPASQRGLELLAHELTHVVQQKAVADDKILATGLAVDPSAVAESEAHDVAANLIRGDAPVAIRPTAAANIQRLDLSLQRSFGGSECSSKGVPCAVGDACAVPDQPAADNLGPSTAWTIAVNIDTEASSWENALRTTSFGHAFVRFAENSGREFGYGFYPASAVPNENQRSVAGCVHHPDNTHDSCTDRRVTYSLSLPQYNAALAEAQKVCRNPRNYGEDYTCVTYAKEIVQAAGQSIPSPKSAPTTVFYQPIPSIDNPNTLQDNVDEETEKDPKKKGFWNANAAPAVRLQPVGTIALSDDFNAPAFKLDWMPVGGAMFRWRLFDDQRRHYLMRGAGESHEVLDWLDFTSSQSAIIGRKTRDLLKQRGVTGGLVQCSVRSAVQGWTDQVATLSVKFV